MEASHSLRFSIEMVKSYIIACCSDDTFDYVARRDSAALYSTVLSDLPPPLISHLLPVLGWQPYLVQMPGWCTKE